MPQRPQLINVKATLPEPPATPFGEIKIPEPKIRDKLQFNLYLVHHE